MYCIENRSQQHRESTKLAVPGWDRTYNALDWILLSPRISPPCQPGMVGELAGINHQLKKSK